MANVNPDKQLQYGIDKEINAAIDAKFDKNSANECIKWIAELSGSTIAANGDLAVLKSGVDLCLAINKLQPGTVAQINKMNSPFFQRENVKNFLEGCRKYGVRDSDLFVTEDLYSGNNYVAVLDCLRSLNGVAVKKGHTKTSFGVASGKGDAPSQFKFDVKATGDTTVGTKQTGGSKYFGAEQRQHSIIRTTDAATNPNATVSQQNSGSVVQNAEKRMDSINRLDHVKK